MAAFCCSIDFGFNFHIKQRKTAILEKCSEYLPILYSAFICTSETCFIFSSCHCDLCWMKQRGWCWSFICFNILPRASNSFILNMWQFYSLDVLMPFLYSESQIKLYPNSPCVLSFHPWYYLASLHRDWRLDICLTMRSAGEIIIIMTVAICLCERICFLIFKISFELFPFLCDYLRYCIFSSDMCQDLSL